MRLLQRLQAGIKRRVRELAESQEAASGSAGAINTPSLFQMTSWIKQVKNKQLKKTTQIVFTVQSGAVPAGKRVKLLLCDGSTS